MTTRDVLRTMLRRWPVLVLGFVFTGVLLVWVHARPGVYSTVTDVYLVAPSGQNVSRQVGSYSASLIALAGVVESRVNATSHVIEPTSPDVTITSMGIYDGSTVVLPNSGTQFVQQFDSPSLRVRASGPTEQATSAHLAASERAIRDALAAIQTEEGVAADARVTTKSLPDSPSITYNAGRPSRAIGTVAALGIGLTIAATVFLDRLIGARWRPRPRSGSRRRTAAVG